jgi:hypothetical protein
MEDQGAAEGKEAEEKQETVAFEEETEPAEDTTVEWGD